MINTKCRTCGSWISEFSPNKSYCSKKCEPITDPEVARLVDLF